MSINKDQLRELITKTLKEFDLYSESAVELLMGTAAVESNLGEYIKQVKGPALGVFQMEPATHDDIWKNYLKYKPVLFSKVHKIKRLRNIKLYNHDSETLIYNLKYAIIMTRAHYLRVPDALPKADNIHGLGYYWKEHYNTRLGAGTIKKFKQKYNKYVRA